MQSNAGEPKDSNVTGVPRASYLSSASNYFLDRRERATIRLATERPRHWYFALVGFQTTCDTFSLGAPGEVRPVVEPPGEVELAGALRQSNLFSAIGRYSHAITHELAIAECDSASNQFPFTFAWWVISAIRIKTLAEFLVPAVLDRSWSVIAAIRDQSCHGRLLEDVPQVRRVTDPVFVGESDLEWVLTHLDTIARLLQEPRFRLAVEALTTHQHLLNHRMMAASIWAGIESLLDVRAELRFRLALFGACLLEPRGPDRISRYYSLKKLYDIRSKAVHGAEMTEAFLVTHVAEMRIVLAHLLRRTIENGNIASEADIERALLEK